MTQRILVTGASGFVASTLLAKRAEDLKFVALSRRPVVIGGVESQIGGDLSAHTDWLPFLKGIDAVVHLAGRVHIRPPQDAAAYAAENCEGTLKLARDAVEAGVSRFIFLSTAKVLGDESGDAALDESAPVRPKDLYAASKLAAERGLAQLGSKLHVTILRPPLVYGPGVRANFFALLSAVARGIPLPFESIRNKRSLISAANLASAIMACLRAPTGPLRTFHVTDGAPVSTPDLVRAMAFALGKPARIFPFPPRMLEFCGAILGRRETVARLTRSFEIDDGAIRNHLGWRPCQPFEAGIAATALWFKCED